MSEPEYLRKWETGNETYVSIANGCKGRLQMGETCDDCCRTFTRPCHRLKVVEIAEARLLGEI